MIITVDMIFSSFFFVLIAHSWVQLVVGFGTVAPQLQYQIANIPLSKSSLFTRNIPCLPNAAHRCRLPLWCSARRRIYFIISSPSPFPLCVFRPRYHGVGEDSSRVGESWRCRYQRTTPDSRFLLGEGWRCGGCCSHLYVDQMSSWELEFV